MTRALEVRDLTKTYGKTRALDAVTFDQPEGTVAGLIGPNGAGKTTLFSLISGIIQADHGEIKIFDTPLGRHASLCGKLSILPQDALFQSHITIYKQMVWYGQLMDLSAAEARAEADRVLDLVDMRAAADKHGQQLSHGMHKRMAIAQTLIARPRYVLLDEPTAGLDPHNAQTIRNLIRNLRGKQTVLVSSHNLEEIADICDFVIILSKGRLVEASTIDKITKQESILAFKLTVEPTPQLIAALRALEPVLDVRHSSKNVYRIACVIQGDVDADPAIAANLITTLAQNGASFTEMNKGSTLEDHFIEMTSS